MATLKKIYCGSDVVVGTMVTVHHHVEREYNSCNQIPTLPTADEDGEYKRGSVVLMRRRYDVLCRMRNRYPRGGTRPLLGETGILS
jgi:hypothetical protein